MLDVLPLELLYLILELVRRLLTFGAFTETQEIDDVPTYADLCKASRLLNRAASPYLYRSVTINVSEAWMRNTITAAPCPIVPTKNLWFTQHLTFEATFNRRKVQVRRCYHSTKLRGGNLWVDSDPDSESDHTPSRRAITGQKTFGFASQLASFLSCLQEHNLKTFRYVMSRLLIQPETSWPQTKFTPTSFVPQFVNTTEALYNRASNLYLVCISTVVYFMLSCHSITSHLSMI